LPAAVIEVSVLARVGLSGSIGRLFWLGLVGWGAGRAVCRLGWGIGRLRRAVSWFRWGTIGWLGRIVGWLGRSVCWLRSAVGRLGWSVGRLGSAIGWLRGWAVRRLWGRAIGRLRRGVGGWWGRGWSSRC